MRCRTWPRWARCRTRSTRWPRTGTASRWWTALQQHSDLLARLDAYHLKASATGVADQPAVANAYGLATAALAERPTKMALASQLVSLYQTYLQTVTSRSAAS